MDSQSEENESEKVINPNDQCVLIFTCTYCGKKYNTIENNEIKRYISRKKHNK